MPGSRPAPPCKVPRVPEVPAPPRAPRRAARPLGGANSAACAAPARKPPAPRRPPRTRPDSPRRRRHRALAPGYGADRARGRGGVRAGSLRSPPAALRRGARARGPLRGAHGGRGRLARGRGCGPACAARGSAPGGEGRGEGRGLVEARPCRLKGPTCTPSRPAHPAAVRAPRAAFLYFFFRPKKAEQMPPRPLLLLEPQRLHGNRVSAIKL